jgi:hypothetical protein
MRSLGSGIGSLRGLRRQVKALQEGAAGASRQAVHRHHRVAPGRAGAGSAAEESASQLQQSKRAHRDSEAADAE